MPGESTIRADGEQTHQDLVPELFRSAGAASVHDPAARSFGIAKLLSHCVRRAASRI